MGFYKSKLYYKLNNPFEHPTYLSRLVNWIYRYDLLRDKSKLEITELRRERDKLRNRIDGMAIQIAELTPERKI